jgi:hypothetical protein
VGFSGMMKKKTKRLAKAFLDAPDKGLTSVIIV